MAELSEVKKFVLSLSDNEIMALLKIPNSKKENKRSEYIDQNNDCWMDKLYSLVDFNYELLFDSIDRLIAYDVTSLRKHQQLIETVLEKALDVAFTQENNIPVTVTEDMFVEAEQAILGISTRTVGFGT